MIVVGVFLVVATTMWTGWCESAIDPLSITLVGVERSERGPRGLHGSLARLSVKMQRGAGGTRTISYNSGGL